MAAVWILLIYIFPRPSTKKRTAVYSDLAGEWMPLVLLRSQMLTATVVDDKLYGLYFTPGENKWTS